MALDRRELLTCFLGAPAAMLLAGCGGGTRDPGPIPGELVGAGHELGHRLRDLRSIPRPAEDRWQTVEVAIVGGGVAGLSAARRLSRGKLDDYVLLELEEQPGGTARSGPSYPWGAHYLPAPMSHQQDIIELLEEMELLEGRDDAGHPLVAEQHLCRDPHERLFYRGRWTEGLYLYDGATAEDRRQLELFEQLVAQWVDWRDGQGRRAFQLPMAEASDDASVRDLDKLSLGDWLRQHQLDSPRLKWLVNYSCLDDYGLTADQTSAWAGLFYFCARVRQAGEESQPFITWPEGNGRLVRQLARGATGKIETSRAVVNIAAQDDGGDGSDGERRLEVIALDQDGKAWGYRARRVIFAAPQFLTRHVIQDWREKPPEHVAAFEYGSWMVANLHLSERPMSHGFPLCWDNVIYDSPALGYVVSTHQSDVEYGPTVLTYYYPLAGDSPREVRDRLLGTGQPEWAEIAVSDLQRAHVDFRQQVERVDVMRWGHAMVRARTGFLFGGDRERAAQPYRDIYFAHSDLSGLPLFEEAFYRGNGAADAVLRSLGRDA
ncbi:MAG: FAD-dependent oxidoreductase [Planctomycetales bacterium]|nr:FAD-dependent oxidoreductase [Planctomycetales bacterium]